MTAGERRFSGGGNGAFASRRITTRRILAWTVEVALAVAPGFVVFLVLFRATLDPRHVAWLFAPSSITFDAATSELGWLYFSTGDWHWPLGSNPNYGGNVANSLLFSDSVPAFLVPLKLIFGVFGVEGQTQFVGIGIVLCLLLQSGLGFALVRTVRGSRGLATAGAALFCLTPVLLRYWSVVSLFWQWLILAGLLIALRPLSPRARAVAWSVVVFVSTGITPYATVMLLALGGCEVTLRGALERAWRPPLQALSGMVAATLLGLYTWGSFAIRPGAAIAEPLGQYTASGLSLLDSGGYSTVIKDLPGGTDNGYAYLGLGVLLLLVLAVGAALRSGPKRGEWVPMGLALCRRAPAVPALLVATVALSVLSVLPELVLGSVKVPLPLPGRFLHALSAFRANGRFMWPLMYLVMLAAVAAAPRVMRRGGAALVAVAVVVQVIDLLPVFRYVSDQVETTTAGQPRLQAELSPLLEEAGVEQLEIVPAYPHPPTVPWRELGLAAHTAGLPLRSLGYFNRYDIPNIVALRNEQLRRLQAHDLDPHTVYVIEKSAYEELLGGWSGAVVLRQLDNWLLVRMAGADPRYAGPVRPQTQAGAAATSVQPIAGFSGREVAASGQAGYWMTSIDGRLQVVGQPSSTVNVTLSVVDPPCGPATATVAGQLFAGGARRTLSVPTDGAGRATIDIRAQSSPCQPAGERRTLYLMVFDLMAAPTRP